MTSKLITFSGFDPCGGAGIQADIEAIGALGGHALPIITTSTVQNTQNITQCLSTSVDLFEQQIAKLEEDIEFDGIKIGLLGNINITQAVIRFIQRHNNLPVVLDPVLASGAGNPLAAKDLIEYIKSELLPLVTIVTPNSLEARRLTTTNNSLDQCGEALLTTGCCHVLITGTHENEQQVNHRLYTHHQTTNLLSYERLIGEYHGSGCTLAAAIAFYLTQTSSVETAITQAQQYCWHSLKHGRRIGKGQTIPNRFYNFTR